MDVSIHSVNADVLGALALTNAGNCRNWICKRVCGVKAVDGGRERGREGEREGVLIRMCAAFICANELRFL